MSFHSALVADAVWPADIRTALGLTGNAVHVGRRAQGVPRIAKEVLILRREVDQRGTGLGNEAELHQYELHVRHYMHGGPDRSGKSQQDAVEADMRTLVDRYHGLRPFVATLTDLVACQAREIDVDVDPDDEHRLVGVVQVDFLVR